MGGVVGGCKYERKAMMHVIFYMTRPNCLMKD